MPYLEALFLGLLQGAVEFFPVSSSGHLLLYQALFSTSSDGLSASPAVKLVDAAAQIGSGLALAIFFLQLYRQGQLPFFSAIPAPQIALRLVLASLPAVCIGTLFHTYIKSTLGSPNVIGIMMILGGILFLIAERRRASNSIDSNSIDKAASSIRYAAAVGLSQALALVPGMSRSGTTIAAGLLLNVPRIDAIHFSFCIGAPILIGAGGYDCLKICLKYPEAAASLLPPCIALIASFAATGLMARPALRLLDRAGLTPFAWYRIALGIIALILLISSN